MTEHEHAGQDAGDHYSQETWDARYAESDRIWSGQPNQRLVEQVSDLSPGRALDVGCGEGADSVWLARQGWQVTALDVSAVALERATAHGIDAGVGDRIEWRHLDLMNEEPPGGYDLVSTFFMHLPAEIFDGFHQRLGDAVTQGGRLLVVGHHPDDLHAGRRPHGPAMLFTPEQVVAALGDEWEIETCAVPTRPMETPEGTRTVTDSVVLARKSA